MFGAQVVGFETSSEVRDVSSRHLLARVRKGSCHTSERLERQPKWSVKTPNKSNAYGQHALAICQRGQEEIPAAPVNPEHTDGKTSHPFDG
jgi:hypothetical protein